MWWISRDLADIKQAVARIEVLQTEMKEDVKVHIRRTAQLEGRMDSQEKISHEQHGAIKLLGIILTIVSIGAAFVAIFHQ